MRTPNGAWSRSREVAVVLAAVLAVLASAAVGYRVLAPTEVVTPAHTDYPRPIGPVPPGVIGSLDVTPLIVDGRLRVYAAERQVRADQPIDSKTTRTPYWSYRRWPAQLVGLVAVGPTVVSRWSDGQLVGLDARTGRVDWRAAGPRPDQSEYAGRRTGATTVYTPAGLQTAPARDRTVLIVTGGTVRLGLDPETGRELWRSTIDPACRGVGLTTTAGQYVTVDTCATPQVAEFVDVATGALVRRWRPDDAGQELTVIPVGCAIGRSACRAIRTSSGTGTGTGTGEGGAAAGQGQGRGWLVAGGAGSPVAAPSLDAPDAMLVGDVAVTAGGRDVVARSVGTGTEMWRWTDNAPERNSKESSQDGELRVLAVQEGRVHLRTVENDLVTLDARTGAQRSRFPLTFAGDSVTWAAGYAYAADGFVAVERLAEPVAPAAADSRYYLAARPVLLAAT
jgi:outer membrane protein assembly factor BamB